MICLELLGMSRAGKTTQKNRLLERLSQKSMSVVTLERPKIAFSEFESLFLFHDFLIKYFNDGIKLNRYKDFIILDRGLYDRQVLLDFDYCSSTISPREYAILKQKLTEAMGQVDNGFVFMIPPEESIRRWGMQRKQGLDYSHLNNGLCTGDDLEGLRMLYQMYSLILEGPKLERIEGFNSREENLGNILKKIQENGSEKRS